MKFDVDSALKSGYSEQEVAEFLASQSKFDLGQATKSGYSYGEVIGFLGNSTAASKPGPAAEYDFSDPSGSDLGSAIMSAAKPLADSKLVKPKAKPVEQTPYRDRREAIDDAVSLLEEGANPDSVRSAFERNGIKFSEIQARGEQRGSDYFKRFTGNKGTSTASPSVAPDLKSFEPTATDEVVNTLKRGKEQAGQTVDVLLNRAGVTSNERLGEQLASRQRRLGAAAPGEEIASAMEAANKAGENGFLDVLAVYANKPQALAAAIAQSAIGSSPGILATTLGAALAGPVGGAAGAGLSSAAMEYGNAYVETFGKYGVDVSDPQQVAAALSDERFLYDARERGIKRGVPVGTFDALTAGLAGKFIGPAMDAAKVGNLSRGQIAGKVLSATGKEIGLQSAGGALGEAGGQAAVGEFNANDIVLEALSEPATGITEGYSNLRNAPRTAGDQAAQALSRLLDGGQFGAVDANLSTVNPNIQTLRDTAVTAERQQKKAIADAALSQIGKSGSVDEAIAAAQVAVSVPAVGPTEAAVNQERTAENAVEQQLADARAKAEKQVGKLQRTNPLNDASLLQAALASAGLADQAAVAAPDAGPEAGVPAPADDSDGSPAAPALGGQPEPSDAVASGQEPARVWYGRRGDGYLTPGDASLALPSRRRESPELEWRMEQQPNGRYRLAGYDAVSTTAATPASAQPAQPAANKPTDPRPAPVSNRAPTPEQYRALATEKAGNPDLFNADLAKELFPEYNGANSAALNDRASAVRDAAFDRRLAEPAKPGEVVTLMAGGTGSGKSTTQPTSGIVYDSTLGKADPKQAFALIDRILATGRKVRLNYVFTDPQVALQRATARAKDIGRTLTLATHAKTHQGANETARAIQSHYAGNERVNIFAYDNSGKAPISLEEIPSYDYNGISEKLHSTLDDERASGRIDDALHRAFSGAGSGLDGQVGGAGIGGARAQALGLPAVNDPRTTAQPPGVLSPDPDSPQTPAIAGVSVSGANLTYTRQRDGTVLVKGPRDAIKAALPGIGGIAGRSGVTFGRSQAQAVAQAIDTLQATQPNAAPPAAPPGDQPDAATQRREFAAAEARRTASGGRLRSNASASNPFRAFLGKHGVSSAVASEFAPGVAERKRALVPGYGPIFRKTGKALDQLAQDAVQEGFLTTPDERQLYDLIERAIRGERVIAQYAEGVAESEGQALIDRQRALEEDAASDTGALPDALLFEVEDNDADIPWEVAGSNVTAEQAMRTLGFTDEEIQNAEIANQPRRPEEADAGSVEPQQTAGGEAPRNRAQRDRAPGPDAEGLTAPSRADIEVQQDRTARADELDQRAQIDREASGFDLQSQTEESRTDNMGDLFGGPSAEDVLTERGRRKAKLDDGEPPLFSREQADPSPGLTRAQFSNAMASAFGKSVASRLEQKGVVVAVQRQSELPDRMMPFLRDGDAVFGAYDPASDKTYVVLENISEGMVRELALHEIGVHYGFERMLGKDKYAQVMRRLDVMRRGGNPAAQDAYLNAKKNAARESDIPEETLAYLVQNAPETSLVQDIIARIKAFLFKEFGIGGSRLTEADLAALARAAVKHASRGDAASTASQQGFDGVPAFGRREKLEQDLPVSIIGNELGSATSHPDYKAAKAGDVDAAVRLGKTLVNEALVQQVRDAIGGQDVLIAPVTSIEASGRNKIPLAVAEVLAAKLGLETATTVVQSNTPKRTALQGLDRIFAQPEFDGEVEPGRGYVLVDDTLTQGATFAALASHIQQNGGRVVATVALTGKQYSATLAPSSETLTRLRDKYADLEPQFQAATGYGFDGLTQSEARYLLNYEPTQRVRDRIIEAGISARQQENQGDAESLIGAASASNATDPDIRFSRAAGQSAANAVRDADVVDLVARVNDRITGSASVRSAARFEELPQNVQDAATDAGVTDAGFRGITMPGGQIFIVHGNHFSLADVQATIVRELYGHVGLRNLFGPDMYRRLNKLYLSMGETRFRELADKYGLTGNGYDALADSVTADASAGLRQHAGGRDELRQGWLMEELLSHIAGKETGRIQQLALEVVGEVRNWLRANGFADLSNLGMADIAFILKQGRLAAEGGRASFDQVPAFSAQRDPASPGYTLDPEGFWLKQRRLYQDYFIRMKQVQDAVRKQGGTISEATDTYMAEELGYGRVQEQIKDFAEGAVKPMVKAAQKANISLDELALYAYAKHAPERNAAIAGRNSRFADGGSGMTDAEAQAIVDRVKADGKEAEYEDLRQRLMGMTQATRLIQLDEGLITPEEYQALQAAYQDYVPLRGFERVDEDDKPTGRGTGKGWQVRGKENMRALGRSSKAGQVIENIIADYERAIVRAERNHIGKVFLNFVQANPDPTLWEVDAEKTKQAYDRQTGKVAKNTIIDKGDDTIGVKLNGQEVFVKIKDPTLARALNEKWKDDYGATGRLVSNSIGLFTSLLRNVYTRFNPEFAITNAVRDFEFGTAAVLDALGEKGVLKFAAHYKGAMSTGFRAETGRIDSASPEWRRYFTEYRAAGGTTGGFYTKDTEEIQADIRGMLIEAGSAPNTIGERLRFNSATRLTTKALRVLELAGATSEHAARVAAYRTAREMGKTPSQAASIAKNLTVNFNRKGEYGQLFNTFYLFYNASVQGTVRLAQMLKNPKVLAYATAFTAATVALAMRNASTGGDDEDDGQSYWDKIPSHVKERNIVIMLPPGIDMDGTKKIGSKGRYLTIPMAYGLNVFSTIGYQIADVYRYSADKTRGTSPGKAAIRVLSSLVSSINPFGGSLDNSHTAVMMVLPTIADIPYQMVAGVNGFGRDVAPYKRDDDPKPNAYNVNIRQSGGPAEKIAQWANMATGGDETESGWIDVSPGSIENFVKSTTGGAGDFLYRVTALGTGVFDAATGGSPDFFVKDFPVYRRLYGEVDGDTNQGLFYERSKKASEAKKKEKLKEDYGKSLTDPEEIAANNTSDSAADTTRDLAENRRDIIRIRQDKTLSDDTRKTLLNILKSQRDSMIDDFNREWMNEMKLALNAPSP